ncbi:MAG: hypothetical protein HY259_11210, partial [Chloroflexi bacterium]|nr:hypothetical protein [Chloroflexota bacterium]
MIALYWLWRLGSFCAGHLPVGLCHGIADLAGTLAYWVLPRQQRHARHNFAQVMGKSADDAAVKRVTRQSFRNFTRYLFEVMRFPYVTPAELDQRVVLHQPEQFEQAVNQNKGVIFVSAHFGNMDLAGVQIARTIRRVTLAAEALKPQQIYDWLVANRARYNVRLIPYRQAAKGLMAALRANEFVGMFLDLGIRYDHRGVPVQFFGETAYFPAAAALLAHHTGAPIIQGYAV